MTLDEAGVQWGRLLSLVGHQINGADSAPVELWALRVVDALLLEHRPSMDDDHSTYLMCKTCWGTWPCVVYQVIERESRHGE